MKSNTENQSIFSDQTSQHENEQRFEKVPVCVLPHMEDHELKALEGRLQVKKTFKIEYGTIDVRLRVRQARNKNPPDTWDQIKLEFDGTKDFQGTFIRAPKISRIGKSIKILATYKNEPVMITNGKHYACSFHPEIGFDYRIHSYFLEKING